MDNPYHMFMAPVDETPKTYDDAVESLARLNAEVGASDLETYSFPDPDQSVFQLLHLTGEAAESDEVFVVRMGKSDDFPFRTAVGVALPTDWVRILKGEMRLPAGWTAKTARKVWPNGRA